MTERLRLIVRGAFQQAEFQPLVDRLGRERRLPVRCQNTWRGMVVEVEGEPTRLDEFRAALERHWSPHAVLAGIEREPLDGTASQFAGAATDPRSAPPDTAAMPDLALCESCRGELLNPNNRRYRYPFINCARCGPRYSIIERLPYTRANTSLRGFVMCQACQREYYDPLDRRYHAEPNACPACGPNVAFWTATGTVAAERGAALLSAANAIRAGQIVAVKHPGGYRLVVDATDEAAVRRLRTRQGREDALLAVMCPDLECVQQCARLGPDEAQLLASPQAPIVLVDARTDGSFALPPAVLGHGRQIGVLLPSTPLQVLLMRDLRRPVAMTSSPPADTLLCIDEREVLERYGGVADGFLVHNRPIVRQAHDTFVRVMRAGDFEPPAALNVNAASATPPADTASPRETTPAAAAAAREPAALRTRRA